MHLPMTVASTSIMGWVEREVSKLYSIKIKNWVVTGESKRGWTTCKY